MVNSFKKCLNLLRDISIYFYKGWQARLLGSYVKAFAKLFLLHLNKFRHSLQHDDIKEEKMQKLRQISQGLYSLLPPDKRFSYSILLPVADPRPFFFQKTLESILNQNIASLEILIGLIQPPSKEVEEILLRYSSKVRVIPYSHKQQKSRLINQLAERAAGNFLLVMGEEDWLRPDFIFRYEQTLRLFSNPEQIVLYCDLNTLNDHDAFIDFNHYEQPSQLCFPFFFQQFMAKGILVPKELWMKIEGFDLETQGAEDEDLLLRLDVAGAIFQHIPFCLYFLRASGKGSATIKSQKSFLKVLEKYTKVKNLNWEWSPGYVKSSARAKPVLQPGHVIQVIIPYKDQKNLTLKCIHSVLKQQDVDVRITAIDNRSTDSSIAEAIIQLGAEVLLIDEPFNFSRLNNLAVKKTQSAANCDILLFLNNDVELEPDALHEMLRWIDHPLIGMVGCRLNYPDGRLQHGGVKLLERQDKYEMRWEHVEKLSCFEEMNLTKTLGIFDAVTAACAMIKRQLFLEVGGFDEVWYPVGYSDTNLAVKINAKGLKCFYTPYAVGIHYESISRKFSIEDYENSWWLHRQLITHQKMGCLPNTPWQK